MRSTLIPTLKQCLKAAGKTYADLAQALELSEPTVKRMFAAGDMPLSRLHAICQFLNMEISDLVRQMESAKQQVTQLSAVAEREITEDLELMLVTVCLFNHWAIADIIQHFTLDEARCIQLCLKLERLGLIELMPGNRVRLLITRQFKWLPNGPFEQFFRTQLGREYFNTPFDGGDRSLFVMNVTLSSPRAGEFARKLDRLAREFTEAGQEDAPLPLTQRQGMTMVLAMRYWDYGLFAHLVRQP